MNKKARYFICCGLFFVIDQAIKYWSRAVWTEEKLFFHWLGWMPFKNFGVAFGLPAPNWLIILFSLPIMALIIFLFYKSKDAKKQIGLLLVLAGALSNLIDRIILKYTVDYFLIFTGVINLADIMIVLGFGLYFISTRIARDVENTQKT